MRRRLLNLLTAVSLLLCAAVVAAGAVSHWGEVGLGYTHVPAGERPVDVVRVECDAGRGNGWVGFDFYRDVHDPSLVVPSGPWWGFHRPPDDPADRAEESFLGFAYHDLRPGDWRIRYTGVAFPLWVPALFFGFVPSVRALRQIRRSRRHSLGHCPSCGYDLRATPGRCPECGTPAVVALGKDGRGFGGGNRAAGPRVLSAADAGGRFAVLRGQLVACPTRRHVGTRGFGRDRSGHGRCTDPFGASAGPAIDPRA